MLRRTLAFVIVALARHAAAARATEAYADQLLRAVDERQQNVGDDHGSP